MTKPQTYTKTQIALHWGIVVLVFFQFFAHDTIAFLWRGRMNGTLPNEPTPDFHVAAGILIFGLMFWRMWLLFRNGAPELPGNEPRILRMLAKGVQGMMYLALLALPLSGAAAWFLGIASAAQSHFILKNLLLLLMFLHIAGALVQHFWFKSDVLMRMLGKA